MQFATQRELSIAYLILRHIYDGDIVEWPVPDDHPHHAIFAALEQQGFLARWDRTWPKADRYRLTEKGIATIEAVYRPAGSETVWNDLRRQNLSPLARRRHLEGLGYDVRLWGLLHDPSTQWDSYEDDGSRYLDYLFEDERPRRRRRPVVYTDDTTVPSPVDRAEDEDLRARQQATMVPYLVDLDREAGADTSIETPQSDYDVS